MKNIGRAIGEACCYLASRFLIWMAERLFAASVRLKNWGLRLTPALPANLFHRGKP